MFNLGDLILIELALVEKTKDIDLGMQCGQQIIEIVGKCEKGIADLKRAAANAGPMSLTPTPDEPPKS